MASGHPDFVSEVTTTLAEAGSFRGGADAAKSASPVSKDVYLATDTKILYVCVTDGTWTGFDASILVQGVLTLYENMDAGSKKITSLAAPTANADAARKLDVDTVDAKLDDVAHTEPSRAVDTIYQNTTGKLKMVTISLSYSGADRLTLVQVDDVTPPVDTLFNLVFASGDDRPGITFLVPDNWYYRVVDTGGTTLISEWHEWDLL